MNKYILLLIGSMVSQSALATVIYKWTDKDGVVHYSQQRPESSKSEKLYSDQIEQKPVGFIAPQITKDPEQKQTDEEKVAETIKADNQEQAESICESAKHSLNVLTTHSRIRSVSEDGATVTAMKEEDRQSQIEEQKQRIKLFCN